MPGAGVAWHAGPMESAPAGREDQDPESPALESLVPGARTSRYAVPMSTLLGGAFVAATDQVEVHPDPPPMEHPGEPFAVGDAVDGD